MEVRDEDRREFELDLCSCLLLAEAIISKCHSVILRVALLAAI